MTRRETIAAFLSTQNTLTLSTISRGGSPHATPLYYLPGEDLRLYWFSSSKSEHSRDLRRDPAAAVAIHAPSRTWRDIRGVQMRGHAKELRDPAVRLAIEAAYARRFHLTGATKSAMARSELYVFTPNWLRHLDNSKGFGYKFELSLAH